MRRGLIAALATASVLAGCVPSDARSDSYLFVTAAGDQPTSASLGTVVVLQQGGGARLRLWTQGGTLTLPSAGPGSAALTSTCILAPAQDSLYYFNVMPQDVECLLYVELLQADASTGSCSGAVLQTRIASITTRRANGSPTDLGATADADAGDGGRP